MSFARILEPEIMDTEADALEYHAMDFSVTDGTFADAALSLVRDVAGPRVVDVGTGTAKIPVLMAKRRRDVRIVALDPSRAMLAVAAEHVRDEGVAAAISLELLDGRSTGLAAGAFDLVICNSTVHHLHDPLALFREMKRLLRPGGGLLVRDLERPASMDDAWATVKRVAAGDSMNQQQLFFDSLCAALTLGEVRALLAQVGWGDLEVTKSSDRHWSVSRAARPA